MMMEKKTKEDPARDRNEGGAVVTSARRIGVVVVMVLACAGWTSVPAEAQWDSEVGIYLWAIGLDGDMTIQGVTASADASFSDLVDRLDFGFSLHVETRKVNTNWTMFFDAYISQLGDDLATPPGEFDLDMAFVELGAAYRAGKVFDVMFGVRYVTFDGLLRIRPQTPGPLQTTLQAGDEQSFVDPMIGGRLLKPIGQKWVFQARADVAGFGIGDGSELTANLMLMGVYQVSERAALRFGYRWMDIDYENTDDLFAMDVTAQGPVLATSFNF